MDQTAREVLLAQLHRQAVLSAAPRAERLRRLPVRLLLPRLLKAMGGTSRVTARTFFGHDMHVHLPDLVGIKLYQYGFFEEALTRAVIEHLRPDDVFIDIGAHVGYYTMLASLMVGPRGKVVAFEPTPRTRRELSSNTIGLASVTLVPAAAWDSPTRLILRDFGWRQSSFNSVLAPRMTKAISYESVEVDAIAVDDWLDEHGVPPNFIKIDAESAEYRVLKGLARTIERHHPILSVEIGDYDLPDVPTSAELIRSLLAQGYDAWQYRDGRLEPRRLANAYGYDNLLFMPSGTNPA
jgi:FkbM family methyltransferase